MMKDFTILKPVIFIISLFVAGIISPSNGVDDMITGNPIEMLTRALIIMAMVISLHLIVTKNFLQRKNRKA